MDRTEDLRNMTINWDRAILVDRPIDEDLVRALTPEILALRQMSKEPITVGINSPGGATSALETLVGLITGPDQDGNSCRSITVVTQHAYSAAATLLASGSYAVALEHSEILFHDVRYGGLEDVTPDSARVAVSQLQDANDEFSLKLANQIFRRLVWNYISLKPKFSSTNTKFPATHKKFSSTVDCCYGNDGNDHSFDIASFATALFAHVSRPSECLVLNAMERLGRWGVMTGIAKTFPDYRQKGSRKPGLLDGSRQLFDVMSSAIKMDDPQLIWSRAEPNLKIVLTLLIENIAKGKSTRPFGFVKLMEKVLEDFTLIESINDPKHFKTASKHLLRHKQIFFSKSALDDLNSEDDAIRQAALDIAMPSAKLFWHFCVLLCRELFNGEHRISPSDAQILGLIDEVAGGSVIKSQRAFIVAANAPKSS